MDYSKFEMSFTKTNRNLKIALAVNFIIASVVIFGLYFQRRFFLYRGGAIFEERPMAEEICRLGFVGLAEGKPNPYVVDSEVIKLAEKENFSIPIQKIYMVKSLENGACKIVLKSEGVLTAFKIKLHGSNGNPFYYRLIQLDEVAPKESL